MSVNRHSHHKFPQTRSYYFMDGTMRRFEQVQYVEMSTWEHIWVEEGGSLKVVIINPSNVKYTAVSGFEEKK